MGVSTPPSLRRVSTSMGSSHQAKPTGSKFKKQPWSLRSNLARCAKPFVCSCKGKASASSLENPTFVELWRGVLGSRLNSKKSILSQQRTGCIELLICKSTLRNVMAHFLYLKLTLECSGTLPTTLLSTFVGLWIWPTHCVRYLRLESFCGTLYYPLL